FGYDDSLDVVGVHLVGGVVGTLMVGLIATADAPSGQAGLLHGGGLRLLGVQATAAGAVLAYSFVLTLVIALVLKKTIGLRVDPRPRGGRPRLRPPPRAGLRPRLTPRVGPGPRSGADLRPAPPAAPPGPVCVGPHVNTLSPTQTDAPSAR
ncbi:MAG: hypothetical protein PGN15_15785, partial [Aeromicrobium erythreum]